MTEEANIAPASNAGNGDPLTAPPPPAPVHRRRGRRPKAQTQPPTAQIVHALHTSNAGPDPLMAELLAKLPRSGAPFPAEARKRWLNALTAVFELLYRDRDVDSPRLPLGS
jgi:hypothetical protein